VGTGLVDALSKSANLITPNIFRELVCLTREKSAENLESIWGSRNVTKPNRNCLILAAKTLLAEFSRKPPAGSAWQPTVDDLWQLCKPRGTGAQWKGTVVTAGQPSDPYLTTDYDRKTLTLPRPRP
jgi:hypothetical protein